MNTIKDFLSELKDRLTNPLFGSFVISWLIYNWPITIALLFYKSGDLKADKYKSFYDLINSRQNNLHMVAYPLVGALIYTFVFPYVKARIKLFHAHITSKNETEILEATKEGNMPMSKFLKLKNQSDTQLENLKKLIDSESEMLTKNTQLETDLIESKKQLQADQTALNAVRNQLQDDVKRSRLDSLLEVIGLGLQDKTKVLDITLNGV